MGIGLVIALAILQGLTEFLPVSSSGHLRLLATFGGVKEPQTLFDIVLHVGTLVPILVVYREQVIRLVSACLRVLRAPGSWADEPDAKVAWWLVVASVPTVAIALSLGDLTESLATDVRWVAAALVVNGGVLLLLGALCRRSESEGAAEGRDLHQMGLRDALVVGTVQGLAIFRGISRSGSTITASMVCGLDREAAASFSFLLSIPVILGALILKWDPEVVSSVSWQTLLLGGSVAAAVGTGALLLLLGLLKKGRLHLFAWYCFALAALTLVWVYGS
ncbi:MAG: undecaprenyl-diphosphate phosphatase [Myxococcota bacterium]|nr:undecaprenyl-diphosphate phosphatase [Myxococcota bacterium]